MVTELGLVLLGTLAASAVLTGLVRARALRRGALDLPNARSSHTLPTPRGGGLAIVLAATGAFVALALLGGISLRLLGALAVGGATIATVGYFDDRRRLSPALRIAVHAAAALWAVVLLGGIPQLQVGEHLISFGWAGYVLGVIVIVWTLNLFNFMDGIDGLAASEAVFVAGSGAALAIAGYGANSLLGSCLALSAASLGFLFWNWPPARIFMGDIGSGYLGYLIAVLALAAGRDSPAGPLVWLILGGYFFVDATVTLVRRWKRGERVYEAHRSHAYQWLARRWRSHGRVTLAVLAIDVVWLLPCAVLASVYPKAAGWITLGALAPIAALVTISGAGRAEQVRE